MDVGRTRTALILAGGLLSIFLLASEATRHFTNPFPPLGSSVTSPVAQLQDFIGITLGLRRLTADIAWIQTLIYYGTIETGHGEEEAHGGGGGEYALFLPYCQRVVRIDPSFKYVYYYGSGVLGWNLNRISEAEELLQEGIQTHPKEWRLQQYLAALAYQKNKDVNKLTQFLELFLMEPDCPNLLRSILANIYKKQKHYHDALRVWLVVYKSKDSAYLGHAEDQIRELLSIIRQ
jgi:tetratricopeptide (TPR) repeat protein